MGWESTVTGRDSVVALESDGAIEPEPGPLRCVRVIG